MYTQDVMISSDTPPAEGDRDRLQPIIGEEMGLQRAMMRS
jgi:hypothetical protein